MLFILEKIRPDQVITPLFADGYNDETQVTATVLSSEPDASADMCAFVGASAALSISEIPFLGPIAAVRLGRIDGELVVNPRALREGYLQELEGFRKKIRRGCTANRIDYVPLSTATTLDVALSSYLARRAGTK